MSAACMVRSRFSNSATFCLCWSCSSRSRFGAVLLMRHGLEDAVAIQQSHNLVAAQREATLGVTYRHAVILAPSA